MISDHINPRVIQFPRPAARPSRTRRIRGWQLVLLIALVSGASPFIGMIHPSRAAEPSEVQTVDGMTAYIGLIPAAIIKGHPDVMMHGGKPSGVNEFHLTVAVFNGVTGQRISDAKVSATVTEVGLAGETTVLEPMHIADTMTYGAFVAMHTMARYDLHIVVSRPRRSAATFDFSYDRAYQ